MSTGNTIAVLDYGMGNLHSVSKALEHVAPDATVLVTDDPTVVADADRVVFPGVGAIRDCMTEINRCGFDKVLRQAISEKPVLGICVGMQALMDHSEENDGIDCLGLMPGQVRFFGQNLCDETGARLKVPHMGWNQVKLAGQHPLWQGIEQNTRFYFVHSYYVDINTTHGSGEWVAASCDYGLNFAAALARGNLFAVQFHPEKSHTAGLQLLKNFAHWKGQSQG